MAGFIKIKSAASKVTLLANFAVLIQNFLFLKVKLLAPCQPSKILAVGRNFLGLIQEMNAPTPDIPLLFLKPPSALIATGEAIILPPQSQRVDHEAELAVVIKKKCRWLQADQVQAAIFGYTIANDVTARDLQQHDGQWTRAKGFDTFCPAWSMD